MYVAYPGFGSIYVFTNNDAPKYQIIFCVQFDKTQSVKTSRCFISFIRLKFYICKYVNQITENVEKNENRVTYILYKNNNLKTIKKAFSKFNFMCDNEFHWGI